MIITLIKSLKTPYLGTFKLVVIFLKNFIFWDWVCKKKFLCFYSENCFNFLHIYENWRVPFKKWTKVFVDVKEMNGPHLLWRILRKWEELSSSYTLSHLHETSFVGYFSLMLALKLQIKSLRQVHVCKNVFFIQRAMI